MDNIEAIEYINEPAVIDFIKEFTGKTASIVDVDGQPLLKLDGYTFREHDYVGKDETGEILLIERESLIPMK